MLLRELKDLENLTKINSLMSCGHGLLTYISSQPTTATIAANGRNTIFWQNCYFLLGELSTKLQ